MGNKQYKNRKFVFQTLNQKNFEWVDVFDAVDTEDFIIQLEKYYMQKPNDAEYRIIGIQKNRDYVFEFVHGNSDIEFYLVKKKQEASQIKSSLNNNVKRKRKKRVLDSIDCEFFTKRRLQTEKEEQEIINKVKKLTLVNYDI